MILIAACMGIVISGFVALAVTTPLAGRRPRDRMRLLAVVTWIAIVVVGWAAFAYLAFLTPRGLEAMWRWWQAQAPVSRVAMWLFLLPWMLATWIWQLPWSEPVRLACVIGIALLTVALAIRQD